MGPGVIDLHVDLPYQVRFRGRPSDLERPGVDITGPALRAGPVQGIVLALYLPSSATERLHDIDDLFGLLETAETIVASNPRLFDSDRISVRFGIEGCHPLAGSEHRVEELVSRGVRLFGLTHVHHNPFADSSQDQRPGAGGLTGAGERLVQQVHQAGAIVDVSHAADSTVRDVVRMALEAGQPVVATHSNARAVADHPRNLSDDLLCAIASTGGVVGLNFHSPFLCTTRRAIIADVVRHAAHMIEVMGVDHLCIGSDFDGNILPAEGLASHADVPALAAALEVAGLSGDEIAAILHVNATRVVLEPTGAPPASEG